MSCVLGASSAVGRSDRCDFLQRVKLVVSGGFRYGGDGMSGESGTTGCSAGLPTRCAFQFSCQDGAEETFPVEYVLRMMSDWASVPCDPYIRIQNTGVSVLFQGFFCTPPGAPVASLSADSNNVILRSTECTGLNLSTLENVKRACGVDARPMQAVMWVRCFVRTSRVQLSFRFMGPEDPSRIQRLMGRISELRAFKRSTLMQQKRMETPGDPETGATRDGSRDSVTVGTSSKPRSYDDVADKRRGIDGESMVRNYGRSITAFMRGTTLIPTWVMALGSVVLLVSCLALLWIN